ncbi:MAG: DUF4358 domain-containing protein [Ruminococcus sp.]|jgi:hypothetical protein|nr:DUF4358 domain-containing protein [Ruminococcus sp.]
MKRIFAAVLAVTAIVSFAGCKDKTAVAGTSVTTAQTVQTTTAPETAAINTETTTWFTSEETTAAAADQRDVDIIAAAVQESVQFPVMVEVDDTERIKDFFLVDPNDYDETLVLQCVLSSNMTEMIIIKTPDTSAAEIALENRKEKAEKEDAFYPADLEKAKNAVIGSYKEYAYYIMSENSAEAEAALKTAVDELEK